MKITIAGWAGTGKSTTATLLASALHCQHYSGGGIFRSFAQHEGLELNQLEKQAEQDPTFDEKLDNYQASLGHEHDDFVMESRLGWYFIPDSFKIKLDCDEETRLERIASREEKEIQEVRRLTHEREQSITTRYRELYGIEDFMSDANFDLVIDTSRYTPEEVITIILQALTDRAVNKEESVGKSS